MPCGVESLLHLRRQVYQVGHDRAKDGRHHSCLWFQVGWQWNIPPPKLWLLIKVHANVVKLRYWSVYRDIAAPVCDLHLGFVGPAGHVVCYLIQLPRYVAIRDLLFELGF